MAGPCGLEGPKPLLVVPLLLVGLLVAAVMAGCAGGVSPNSTWDAPSSPLGPDDGALLDYDRRSDPWAKPAQVASISIELPPAARETLDLVTLSGRFDLSDEPVVSLPVTGADGGILGVLVTEADSRAVAVAYIPPAAEGAPRTLAAREVTLGNVYISPAVLLAPASERGRILAASSEAAGVEPLVAESERVLAAQPTGYLAAVVASGGFRKATDLSIELTRAVARARADIGTGNVPRIEDLPAQDLHLVNPRLTTYGYRVQTADERVLRDGLVYGRANYFAAMPRWPYITRSQPVRELLTLPDGRYVITFYKGMSLDAPDPGAADPDTPWGQASLVNTLNLTTVVSDALGFFPQSDPDVQEWNRRVERILEALGETADPRGLEASLQRMHLSEVILTVLDYSLGADLTDLLLDLTSGIEDAGVAQSFFELMRDVYAVADQVYLAVQFLYTDVGFVYDLLSAPGTVAYDVRSTRGVLTEVTEP